MYSKNRLIELIREHSLRFGEFRLASGKTASYYLDCRRVTLHPAGINQIASGMLDSIRELWKAHMPQAVGGMAIGADPITASIVTLAGQQGIDLLGFMVRKEPKQHGMGNLVEGPVTSGMRCVIVEDVVTSGSSALKAAQAAREFGMEVLGVLAIIDRLEGGKEAFEAAGLPLYSLLDIRDFGIGMRG
jgi:orotate phosphoribosyltransferase